MGDLTLNCPKMSPKMMQTSLVREHHFIYKIITDRLLTPANNPLFITANDLRSDQASELNPFRLWSPGSRKPKHQNWSRFAKDMDVLNLELYIWHESQCENDVTQFEQVLGPTWTKKTTHSFGSLNAGANAFRNHLVCKTSGICWPVSFSTTLPLHTHHAWSQTRGTNENVTCENTNLTHTLTPQRRKTKHQRSNSVTLTILNEIKRPTIRMFQLSNEARIVNNGALEIEIWFPVDRR